MAHLLISAARKSSGKTTVAVGLCQALSQRGLAVQPFKKGPDYIDPLWLGRACGRDCHNLDFHVMSRPEIVAVFGRYAHHADLSIIEGNKGLYDGLDLDGSNSNAALASLLGTPVVLVIDARGMTRGIAPLILGYQAFDSSVNIVGVILNNLGGRRHEAKLRVVIEHYTNVQVIGAVHRNERLAILERHLGLMPSNEHERADEQIKAIGNLIAEQVDLDRLLAVTQQAQPVQIPTEEEGVAVTGDIKIGVARDAAFGFYYPGDLEGLQRAGAELIFFDTLKDESLPDIDALFIGGGFPETQMEGLERNETLRLAIRSAIEAGMPAYAECGGLMYLARSLTWRDKTCRMAGVISADVVMHDRPQGRGYVQLRETGCGLWPLRNNNGTLGEIPAHEFHYSSLENIDADFNYAYDVLRGHGLDGKHDGLCYKNLMASYSHLRDVSANRWAARFVEFARSQRQPHAAAAVE